MTRDSGHDLEIRFETGRGYYLRLPASDLEDKILEPVFVNVVTRKKFVEMTTLELMKRNLKASGIAYKGMGILIASRLVIQ